MSTVLVCLALAGCVDARKSYDDYATRIVDANTSMPDRPFLTTIPDATGHFLLSSHAAAAGDSSPPIELVSDWVVTANQDGTATISHMSSALTYPDHNLSAGPPVAPQFSASGGHVNLDGTFDIALDGDIPADSNPIVLNARVTLNGTLHGVVMSTDMICGTITGVAGPLPLDGSTFATVRIAPGTVGAALPDPVVACPPM